MALFLFFDTILYFEEDKCVSRFENQRRIFYCYVPLQYYQRKSHHQKCFYIPFVKRNLSLLRFCYSLLQISKSTFFPICFSSLTIRGYCWFAFSNLIKNYLLLFVAFFIISFITKFQANKAL